MARFYDAVNSSELATIEEVLQKGGVEYTLNPGKDDFVCEILVAEEDLAFAESLLSSPGEPVGQKAGLATH